MSKFSVVYRECTEGKLRRHSDNMTRPEFLVLMDDLLELPTGTLTGSEKLENLEGWNSLALIGYMALVDEHMGVKLSPRQFLTCQTVDDLLSLAKVAA